jgi:hypothetical protein
MLHRRLPEARAAPPPTDRPVRLAYQPPASSTFLSEQTSQQQPANNTFLSEQTSTSHQPLAIRTGWEKGGEEKISFFQKNVDQNVLEKCWIQHFL